MEALLTCMTTAITVMVTPGTILTENLLHSIMATDTTR